MGQIALSLPQTGLPNSTEDVKVTNDLTILQNVINGNLDSSNIAATLGQAASVNVAGQTVKGATNIATSESRSNAAYGTLTTPDQVTVALPVNGLIQVWYQATWKESVLGAASAAIFLNANQLKLGDMTVGDAELQQSTIYQQSTSFVNHLTLLTTGSNGLASRLAINADYAGDATTGQVVGSFPWGNTVPLVGAGGPCYIFAAAGTYTVAIMFKSSSGSVTASNRKLWVQALSFA